MTNKPYRRIGYVAGALLALFLVGFGLSGFKLAKMQPRQAPEAEKILQAQAGMPFQVLIPAYLPGGFDRKKVEILTDQPGPQGEPMLQLVYSTHAGVRLTLSEWLPGPSESIGQAGMSSNLPGAGTMACNCFCKDHSRCNATSLMRDIGTLRIMGETSQPQILSRGLVQTILNTLAPASGLEVISSLEQVPLSSGLPTAVEVPVDSRGVQEVILIVSPEGYNPVHFSVKKNLPVRLIFKLLGQVGCGNELFIEWGKGQEGHLILNSPGDQGVLEFTPQQEGEFSIHCPHYIYQGVMTVRE